jgi:Ala-tRNA(Pro) deacylase
VTGNVGPSPAPAGTDVYGRLIAELDAAGARYRLIEHAPEGRTEMVSALRGHALASAAKCLVLLVKIGKKQTRYVLAVVPGDARLDLAGVKALLGASYVAFADAGKAEQPHHRHLTRPPARALRMGCCAAGPYLNSRPSNVPDARHLSM